MAARKNSLKSRMPVPWVLAVAAALLVGILAGHYLLPAGAATSGWAYNCPPPYPTLREWSGNHNCVRLAQSYLRQHGYNIAIDGVFGGGTLSAVHKFQTSKGLYSDGVIGPKTWNALTTF